MSLGKKIKSSKKLTYISGELLERMKHVEAVEVYDTSCQCVIMSDNESRMLPKQRGHDCKLYSEYVRLFV